jgi:hypothetical protein
MEFPILELTAPTGPERRRLLAMSGRSGGMTHILDDSTGAVSSIPPSIKH